MPEIAPVAVLKERFSSVDANEGDTLQDVTVAPLIVGVIVVMGMPFVRVKEPDWYEIELPEPPEPPPDTVSFLALLPLQPFKTKLPNKTNTRVFISDIPNPSVTNFS